MFLILQLSQIRAGFTFFTIVFYFRSTILPFLFIYFLTVWSPNPPIVLKTPDLSPRSSRSSVFSKAAPAPKNFSQYNTCSFGRLRSTATPKCVKERIHQSIQTDEAGNCSYTSLNCMFVSKSRFAVTER